MKLLVDADYIVYKCCAGAETEVDYGSDVIVVSSKFTDAMKNVERELEKISLAFPFQTDLHLYFSDSTNFRKSIEESYKGHRNRKKPCGYKRVINELYNRYPCKILPTLEADDAMGIYATLEPGNVIVSPDKDMRQIPGQLYNMTEMMTVTPEEGRNWHFIQTLAGDQTDGYSGVPGIGIKRAVSLFEENGYNWKTVVEAFEAKDLDEEHALMNARLAKILTIDEYDFKKSEPILWTPTSSDGADDGTRVKVAAD